MLRYEGMSGEGILNWQGEEEKAEIKIKEHRKVICVIAKLFVIFI